MNYTTFDYKPITSVYTVCLYIIFNKHIRILFKKNVMESLYKKKKN